jgi:hypothetical protein
MDATRVAKDKITISFPPNELAFLSNAINEALEAVEDWEFQTRTGETRKRASEIQAQLQRLLDESQHAGD